MLRYVFPSSSSPYHPRRSRVPNEKYGLHAKFTVRDGIGIKFYRDEDNRNKALDYQEEAAALGLAPDAYGPCEVYCVDEDGIVEKYYGYLTEVTETHDDNCDINIGHPQFNRLQRALKLHWGCKATGDLHSNNIGLLADGRLVCIDTGWF